MNHSSYSWLDVAKQLQSIAQAGLEYSTNKYDLDRYEQLRNISIQVMNRLSGIPVERLMELYAAETGYQTPKVDVRGVVFREDKILMVHESIDNCWSIPGGWADIGHTPFEVARKEVWEESGLEVEPLRLLAVLDKKCHKHPPDMYHIYKLFILCRETGGSLKSGMETLGAGFFNRHQLPPLSESRITREQIDLMYTFLENPGLHAKCD